MKSGAGYEKFIEMVRAQGGDVSVVEDLSKYPKPKIVREIKASASGYVTSIDTFKIGVAAVKLGAGRLKVGDKVDPVVGITVLKKIGDKVSSGDVIAIVHANEENIVKPVTDEILSAYKFSDAKPGKQELIKERIA